jgi:hypothetical protein
MVRARDASRTSTIPRTEDGIKRRGAQGTSKRTAAIAASKSSQYAVPDGDGKGNSGPGRPWVVPASPFGGGWSARGGEAAVAPAAWTLPSPALKEEAAPDGPNWVRDT